MLINFAAYTKDVSTMMDSFSCMGNQINQKLEKITQINKQTRDSILMEKLSMSEEDSDILKLEMFLTSLNKEHFKLSSKIDFVQYFKEVTKTYKDFEPGLQCIKNRILKTYMIRDRILYATQRYEEGNKSIYLIDGLKNATELSNS